MVQVTKGTIGMMVIREMGTIGTKGMVTKAPIMVMGVVEVIQVILGMTLMMIPIIGTMEVEGEILGKM